MDCKNIRRKRKAGESIFSVSETILAGPVIDRADATMLMTADRGFFDCPF
jgi:hypothetical protein